ncbi:hypothetical protein [Pollutibacter soli]|uniref:hypothetical protein n=1 Tax=Pollutibacter soli TaxID=3034157 RepID=UPI003013679D
MLISNTLLFRALILPISIFSCIGRVNAQQSFVSDQKYEAYKKRNQQIAIEEFLKLDTTSGSLLWPNIDPVLFFSNIRQNIISPDKINQGHATNFCGYAAMTHLLIKYHPDIYLDQIIKLYRNGSAPLKKKNLDPSERVRNAAGTLKNKGELDILHADQLWFLSLADEFKGYINIFDHKYHPGDENKIWAGTNYAKFNKMLKEFTDDYLRRKGSDFIRPMTGDFYEYISKQLELGIVLLYVNSKHLYPHKFSLFKLRAPTHFIVQYEMYKVGDQIMFRYWDYGLKTEQLIPRKRLRKLIFGITTIDPQTGS